MHVNIVHSFIVVRKCYRSVLIRCKPYQSVLVQENPKRIATQYQHIKSKIKFQSINQIRFLKIFLDDVRLDQWYGVQIMGHENAFALTHTIRLHNHREIGSFLLFTAIFPTFLRRFVFCLTF